MKDLKNHYSRILSKSLFAVHSPKTLQKAIIKTLPRDNSAPIRELSLATNLFLVAGKRIISAGGVTVKHL